MTECSISPFCNIVTTIYMELLSAGHLAIVTEDQKLYFFTLINLNLTLIVRFV